MHLELGGIRLVVESEAEMVEVLTAMLRHLTNKEVAGILGVSERTVRRWKEEGRLPDRGNEQVTLAELVAHLLPLGSAHNGQEVHGPSRAMLATMMEAALAEAKQKEAA